MMSWELVEKQKKVKEKTEKLNDWQIACIKEYKVNSKAEEILEIVGDEVNFGEVFDRVKDLDILKQRIAGSLAKW